MEFLMKFSNIVAFLFYFLRYNVFLVVQLDKVKVRKKRSSRGSPALYSSTLHSEDEDHPVVSGINHNENTVLIQSVPEEIEYCDIRETVELVL